MTDPTTKPLDRKYLGTAAQAYDESREQSPRRKAELAALDEFFSKMAFSSLLDIPCGTGRLFELYFRHGSPNVLGIDVSDDMLAMAAKTESARTRNVVLKRGSVFDPTLVGTLEPVDVVCCIRFLNWISRAEADQVLRTLRPLARSTMIVGVTLTPTGRSLSVRIKSRARLTWQATRGRMRGTITPTIHPHAWFRSLVDELGLRIVDSRQVLLDESRENRLFLLAPR
jgi:SAM-dependent methyltransferase